MARVLLRQICLCLCLSVLLGVRPLVVGAETHPLSCGSSGVPYEGVASLSGHGTVQYQPERATPSAPTTPQPGTEGGLTPEGKVPSPTTPGPSSPEYGPFFVSEDSGGNLTITGSKGGVITGDRVGRNPLVGPPVPQWKQCDPQNPNIPKKPPECGPGSNPGGNDKKCGANKKCIDCECRQTVCFAPRSDCNSPTKPCGENKICNDKGNGLCKCEPTYGSGGAAELRSQADFDFLTDEEEAIYRMLLSEEESGGSPSREGVTSNRANRSGVWYWISSYPAALVNWNLNAAGEELQIYQAGVRSTFQRVQNSNGTLYYLVREEDAYGNATTYERDAAQRVVAENHPGNLRIEYTPFPTWAQGYVAKTFRCLSDQLQNCSEIDEIRYRLNVSGAPTEITYTSVAPYVTEPSTSQGVHNITSVQNDPLIVRYGYDASETKVTSIEYERGGVTRVIAQYEYYSSYSPNSGKLWKITDENRQVTTVTYPTLDTVVMTLPTGEVQRTRFDSYNRIVESTSSVPTSTTSTPTRVGVRYAYASGSRCDRTMSEMSIDRGDGQYIPMMNAVWDVDLYRLLAVTVPGPNGGALTTTYDDYTEWLDGNVPQSIVTPSGPLNVMYEFGRMLDPSDSRFRVTGWISESVPVTEAGGSLYSAVSEVALFPTGLIDTYSDADGVAQYVYDANGLLIRVETGPTGAQGNKPDMTSPYSYTAEFIRDPETGEVTEARYGSGPGQVKSSYTYAGGALTRVAGGGGEVEVSYSRWGEIAARYVSARDANGGAFGGTGRQAWGVHNVRNDNGQLLGVATDVASPFSAAPEYSWTRYGHDSYGRVVSVEPDFGAKQYYTYNERNELIAVHRDSPQGVLMSSFSQTPSVSSSRFLSGEHNGQAVYTEVTKNISPAGYVTSVSSSTGGGASFQYNDIGLLSEVRTSMNGVMTARSGATYDEWGRVVATTRYNPVTGAAEVLSTREHANGRLKRVLDRYGVLVAEYGYNEVGGVSEIETPLSVVRYEVEPYMGRNARVAETTGGYTRVYGYEYEAGTGLLSKMHDYGAGSDALRTVSVRYDSLGRAAEARSSNGMMTETTYGPDGRVWRYQQDDELTVNNTYVVKNGEYVATRSIPGEGSIERRYGAFGILSEEFSDGRRAEWTYDGLGFLKTHETSDGRTRTISRDVQGRIASIVSTGRYETERLILSRDAHNRVYKQEKIRGREVSSYEVTEFGEYGEVKSVRHLESQRGGGVPLEITYERRGRDGRYAPDVVSGISLNNAASWSSERDSFGRLTAFEFSGGNDFPAGQPARFEFGYDGGVQNSLRYPGSTGLKSEWNYSSFGELQAVVNTQGGDKFLSGRMYERDSLSRVVRMNGEGRTGTESEFSYVGSRLAKADEDGDVTEFTFGAENKFMLREKAGSNGNVLAYEMDDRGRYSSIGGHPIEYDDESRITRYGAFAYEYQDSDLLPEAVTKDGKLVRSFDYDMFGNLIATEDAAGNREEFVTYGLRDYATVEPESGELKRAFVGFPGVEREKVASVGLQDGEKSYFYTNLSPVEGSRAYTKNGELAEEYTTSIGNGTFAIRDAAGGKATRSVTGARTGFHGLRAFDDISPEGDAMITPLRVLFAEASFANAPDPLLVPAQKWTLNDSDSVNKSDPSGGQTKVLDNFRGDAIGVLRQRGATDEAIAAFEARDEFIINTWGGETCMRCHGHRGMNYGVDLFGGDGGLAPGLVEAEDFGIAASTLLLTGGTAAAGGSAIAVGVAATGTNYITDSARHGSEIANANLATDVALEAAFFGIGRLVGALWRSARTALNSNICSPGGKNATRAGRHFVIDFANRDDQVRALANRVPGLGEAQARYLIHRAEKGGADALFIIGSRIRGDFRAGSDIDVGFQFPNKTPKQAEKEAKRIAASINARNADGEFGPGGLPMERTPIVSGFTSDTHGTIRSPQEFSRRSGVRTDGRRVGEAFGPSGFIKVYIDQFRLRETH